MKKLAMSKPCMSVICAAVITAARLREKHEAEGPTIPSACAYKILDGNIIAQKE